MNKVDEINELYQPESMKEKKIKIDIITYISGYSYEVFERFIGSLNDTGFSGNIYLIINSQDKPIIRLLKQKYDNIRPIVDNLPKRTHINCHRFFCIKQLLQKLEFTSDYFLICDSRDVLFQKNLETYPYDPNVDIYGFQEGITIAQEKVFNTPWIKMVEQIMREPVYDLVADNKIICCGTTIGKRGAIQKYVYTMCDIIERNNIRMNLDQGIHNYLLYLNKLDVNIKILSNQDNLVNTIGNDIHILDDEGRILNRNNEVSYIVHQYDRCSKENREKLSKKYNFSVN
jgi:hypothetical protein